MTHSGDSVEERLRRLEDTEQIRQLNLEYRRHLDARDLDAYGRLFAADGEWLGGTGYGKGPAGITAMLKERLVGNPAPPGPTSWHLVTEPKIDVHGDRATGTIAWALVQRGDGDRPVMRLLGHYDDDYVRERGRWRYQRRVAHTDLPHRELEMPSGWSSAPSASGGGGEATAADAAAGSVEARLRGLEDTEQIRRLTQEYRHHLDAMDLDAYGRLFADDGEWLGGIGYGMTPAGIAAMLKERLPARSSAGPTSWHLVTEPEIQLEGDRATGLLSWTWLGRGDGNTPVMRLLGRYEDSYVRERGQWRYQRRISHTDIPHGELEMPPGWSSAPSASGAGGGATAAPDAAAGSVEARLRRLEDLAQIRRLFVDYKIVLDKQDFGAYAALFAEDGEFIAGTQRVKGRAAIQALVDGMRGSLLGSAPGDDFHVVVNPLIDLDAADPDRARAEVTWLYVVKGEDGGPALAKLGHYEDVLVRQACRWLFGRREAPTDIG